MSLTKGSGDPKERCTNTVAWPRMVLMTLLGIGVIGLLYYRELTRPVVTTIQVQPQSLVSGRLAVAAGSRFHLIITSHASYPVIVSTFTPDYEVKLFDAQGNELTNLRGFLETAERDYAGIESAGKLLKPGEACTIVVRPCFRNGWRPIPKEAVRAVAISNGGNEGFLASHFRVPVEMLREKPSVSLR